ncbi:MAG: Ppx/GppA family phosphatase [Colwellia sp.]|nr:Ppx/GppA family phosphatase [Colwellia sp.]
MNKKKAKQTIVKENYIAALDLGSNSFHFVLARQLNGHLQIVHAEKYRVQLAQGLQDDNILSPTAIQRGVSTLENLAKSTQHLTSKNFRAVATFTLRQAKNSAQFLKAAAQVFPFDIEIISGHEEARLIYQGVNHYTQSSQQRLIIDIGGGSTECALGQQQKIAALASLTMGCVSYSQKFFKNGVINDNAFCAAIRSAQHEIDSVIKRFKKSGWQEVIGTSGTIKSISKVLNFDQHLIQPIQLSQLLILKKQLIACKHCDSISITGINTSRRNVFSAGLAILIALMKSLKITQLDYCQYALREGVLIEQLDSLQNNNIRQRTVINLIARFNIDTKQVALVDSSVQQLFNAVQDVWQLKQPIYHELLIAAVQLHELGLDINPSGYHKHGQYILTHADLSGFNQEQQQALAWLVGNQRKKTSPLDDEQWYLLKPQRLKKLVILLRLSILLSQQRQKNKSALINALADKESLTLLFDKQWLLDRPIVDTELFYESELIEVLDIKLIIKSL